MKKELIRFISFALCLFLFFTSAGCGAGPRADAQNGGTDGLARFTGQFTGPFDTVTSIVGYAENERGFQQIADRIRMRMEYFHRLFSIYDRDRELTSLAEVNEKAGRMPVKVEPEVIELLEAGKQFCRESSGQLNTAMGAVLSLWHDARESKRPLPPDKEKLLEAGKHSDQNDLILDQEKSEIRFQDPLLKIDVGALAKGWAVERVAQELEKDGVSHYLISAGGNVRAIGAKPDGSPWTVGIRHPDKRNGDFLDTVEITGGSVVTSGVYERFFEYEGILYHHIIDPRTLYPSDAYLSVSIVCADSGIADALSTSLFNLSEEEGNKLAEQYDAAVLRMFRDGTVRGNTAWEQLKIKNKN